MRRVWRPLLSWLVCGVLGSACNSPTDETVCPGVLRPALVVEVRDANSRAPLGAGTTVWYQLRGVRDSLPTAGWITADDVLVPIAFAGGRGAGTYRVDVSHLGYRLWTAIATVRAGVCGLETAELHAELVPTS